MTEQASPDAEMLSCTYLIFTAVSSEWDAVKAAAKEMGCTFTKVASKTVKYYWDLGILGGGRVMMVETEMGPFSFDGSAARAINSKIETGATALIGLGMAFGINRKQQKHGDILVSRSLLTYDDREVKCNESGEMEIRFSSRVRHEARPPMLKELTQEARRSEAAAQPEKVWFGSVLSGGSAIRCATYRDDLVRQLREVSGEIIGGEMDGCGLIAARGADGPSWVLVKGISDFADEHRDKEIEEARPLACKNAARFLLKALRDFDPGDVIVD